MRNLVRDFVEEMLGGSLEPFVTYLVEAGGLTDRQLRELRQLVDQIEHRPEEP